MTDRRPLGTGPTPTPTDDDLELAAPRPARRRTAHRRPGRHRSGARAPGRTPPARGWPRPRRRLTRARRHACTRGRCGASRAARVPPGTRWAPRRPHRARHGKSVSCARARVHASSAGALAAIRRGHSSVTSTDRTPPAPAPTGRSGDARIDRQRAVTCRLSLVLSLVAWQVRRPGTGRSGCVGDSGEHLSVGFENDDEADALEMFARSKSSRVVRVGSAAGL